MRTSRLCGFTLAEVLVAAGLALVVALLALRVLTGAMGRWERALGGVECARTAHRVLDQLERDLQGAVLRADGGCWLAATVMPNSGATGSWVSGGKPASDSLDPAAPDLRAARFGVGGVWLRFVTASSAGLVDPSLPNVPVAVSYVMIRRGRTSAARNPTYALYRKEAGSLEALNVGYDLSAPPYVAPGGGVPVDGLMDPGFPLVVAEGVIDFGVRFYARRPGAQAGTTLLTAFPRAATDLDYELRLGPGGTQTAALPEAVDIFVRVLSPAGARRLTALERGLASGEWWKIASENSAVFTRRVWLHLPAQGL